MLAIIVNTTITNPTVNGFIVISRDDIVYHSIYVGTYMDVMSVYRCIVGFIIS